MATLVPVDGDPFASSGAASTPKLTPVEGNPFEAKTASAPVSIWGLLKSVGSGAVRGLESGAANLGQAAAIEQTGGTDGVPDAEQTQGILDKVVGKPYEPQNGLERIAHAGGAALGANPPLAAMTGPLSTMAAGAASGAAHEAAKDTPLDLPAQIIAPLLMGKAVNTARNAANSVVRKITANPSGLTSDELNAASKAGFKQLDNSDLELHPTVGEDWALPMSASLEKRGLDADTAPITNKVLDGFVGKNDNITSTDILKTRSKLGELSQQKDVHGAPTSEAKAASDALHSFDDLVTNPQAVPASAVLNGDLAGFQKVYKDAAGNWGAARRLDRWDTAMNDAENNAGSTNSGHNLGNAQRTSAKRFVNGKATAARGMNEDETNAIQDFVRGGGAGLRTLRTAGKMLGSGGGVVAGAEGLAGLATGNPALMAAPLVGMGLGKLYNMGTQSQANSIADMLATNSPLARSMGASNGIQNLLGRARAMHLTERIIRASRGPEAVWAQGQ